MDLELRNISKSFSGVKALKGVQFCANHGEVCALLGENGAGKSTLIKILSGFQLADEGEIILDGQKLDIRSPRDAFRYGIATVYQELSLAPNLDVAHNVFLYRPDMHVGQMINRKDIERRTQELLDRYDIKDVHPTDLIRDLGLPFRQMIEIVKALAKDPKVVILDEATSALPEDRVEWLLKIARQMAEEGRIVIFISHRLAEIYSGCDRVIVYRNGEYVGERKVSETNNDELVAMMLGRKQEGYFPPRTDTASDEISLEIDGIHYGRYLHGIDLQVRKGEIHGIGGLAGQGQSELFRCLAGVIKPQKGRILVDGKPIVMKKPADAFKYGIALIPEDRSTQGLILELPIRKNITFPVLDRIRRGLLLDGKREDEIIRKSMDHLRIKAVDEEMDVNELSGGNQQKVVFSKLFAIEPKIFLLYDCTRGVDVGTKSDIFVLLRDLASQGYTILYYSSDVEELVNLCDTVSVVCDGKVSAHLSGKNITKDNIILASVGEAINDYEREGEGQ